MESEASDNNSSNKNVTPDQILDQDNPEQDDRDQEETTEASTSTQNSSSQIFRSKSNYSLKLKKDLAKVILRFKEEDDKLVNAKHYDAKRQNWVTPKTEGFISKGIREFFCQFES